MATDGLWDVMPNDRVAEIVDHGLSSRTLTGGNDGKLAQPKNVNFSDDEMDQEVRRRSGYSRIHT